MNSSNKKIIIFFLVVLILFVSIFLSGKNITDPFIRFNEDNNALYGIAAYNWSNFGFLELKMGMATSWMNGLNEKINYYTHHPSLFLLPTALIYKFFGFSEFTTRISPIIFSLLSIIIFFLLVLEVYKKYFLALVSSFILATLPAMTFYGKMLDQEIFIFFFALLAFYLFFKIKNNPGKKLFVYLIFPTILIGNFIGWHFYFISIIIWLLILVDKNYPKRKLFIVLIPLISLFSLFLIIYHFYILGGEQAILDLKRAFFNRTSDINILSKPWLNRMYFLFKLNFTLPIILLGLGWLVYFFLKPFKNGKINLGYILLLFPLLVTFIFGQWVTHPYGPFYFAAFFSFAAGEILYFGYNQLVKISKKKIFSFSLIIFLLIIQFYSGLNGLKFFDEKLILSKKSIELLKEVKNDFNPKSICQGRDPTGIGYNSIFSFYLKMKVKIIPPSQCLEEKTDFAIIFRPQFGKSFKKEAQLFTENGYQYIKCKGEICLLENKNSPLDKVTP